jgi:hypothetical protein
MTGHATQQVYHTQPFQTFINPSSAHNALPRQNKAGPDTSLLSEDYRTGAEALMARLSTMDYARTLEKGKPSAHGTNIPDEVKDAVVTQ